MAFAVKLVERDILLESAMSEKAPISINAADGEFEARLSAYDERSVSFVVDLARRPLMKGEECAVRFVARGQTVAFRSTVAASKPGAFTLAVPEEVWKNLSRRFARASAPPGLKAALSFGGERYALDFPTTLAFDPVADPVLSKDFDPADLRGLVKDFERRASEIASERAIVMYKDREPATIEERVAIRTGRAFFLPTPYSGVPEIDPFPRPRILVRDDFREFFAAEGAEPDFVEEELTRFERQKRNTGVLSEILAPIVFQEYVIGSVRLANRQPGRAPFDLGVLDTWIQFTRVLAWSLNNAGYFRGAPKRSGGYKAEVVDLSAGGVLFVSRDPILARALAEDSYVQVELSTDRRTLRTGAAVKRRIRERGDDFYGLEFIDMGPEDFRFLFELLYGRPFTDDDADLIEGLPPPLR